MGAGRQKLLGSGSRSSRETGRGVPFLRVPVETPLLDAFAQELLDKVRTVLRDSDHATKLERVAALISMISETPSGVTALAVHALVASVDELGARIDAVEVDAKSGDELSATNRSSGALPRLRAAT